MAVGYPELFTAYNELPETALEFTEGMYGAIGEVLELFPQGRATSRPWPAFRASAQWRSGMSGGPVFNEHGEVVGLVSTSDYDGNDSYGFWFEPSEIMQVWLPMIDPMNPGWFKGWGVVRSDPWHLAAMCLERQEAESYGQQLGQAYEARYGSNRYGSDDFVSESRSDK
jgi:serine protease Do